MKSLRIVLFSLLCLQAMPAGAGTEMFDFSGNVDEQRYMALISQLRCLVCQNQSLADSHADLAGDLRRDIFNMMGEGKSKNQIIDFLVQRYGDFVLYRPPLQESTVLLWFLPFVFLVVAVLSVIYFVRQRTTDGGADLSQDEKEKLEQVLGKNQSEV